VINPWFIIAALIAFGAATGGAYIRGRSDGKDSCLAESAREERIASIVSDSAASAAAQAISQIKVQNRTIQNEVQRTVSERVVYRDPACAHDAAGMLTINAAITGKRPESVGSGVMP
jgi:hypothetical protein